MINGVTTTINVDEKILLALQEDITSEDVTTNAIIRKSTPCSVELICKQEGILAGIDVFKRTFELLGDITFTTQYQDGDSLQKGDLIGILEGDARVVLSGERTALNYLQRMSGIATLTRDMVQELEGSKTKLLDTRKTTPGIRVFEKYAVKVGGGYNHRFNLSDGILIKDNHINAAGGVKEAINMALEYAPFVRKIEVEVEDLQMLEEALEAKADIIMLDNMSIDMMKEAVERVAGRAKTECSGNVSKERLRAIAEVGVDYVSCGALTHSAPILDFSLKNLKNL
ncbi:MAG: carboxylating nicotinate-nucleotide diphosphorylase [Niameybacter sp.]